MENNVVDLSLLLIDPNPEPIRELEMSKFGDLKDSIRKFGVLQPILVRPSKNGRYEIVFGHLQRRLLNDGF